MYYLRQGFSDRGFPTIGQDLGLFFRLDVYWRCLRGGQYVSGKPGGMISLRALLTFFMKGGNFGLVLGIMVGLVIIGGIVWIARVTSFLVPFMCVSYIIAALVIIIGTHIECATRCALP